MHMALYCRTAGLQTEGMEMNLVYNIVEEQGKRRIETVTVDVHLPENPGPRGNAVLRAAENCIVRNTLEKAPEIDIALGEE